MHLEIGNVQELAGSIRFKINVKPRSRENKLIIEPDGTITLRITALPQENRANKMVVRFLADKMCKTTSQVRIVAGYRSSIKVIEIEKMKRVELSRLLAAEGY